MFARLMCRTERFTSMNAMHVAQPKVRWKQALQASRILLCCASLCLCLSAEWIAAPLDFLPFTSLRAEGFYSWINGRMGSDQEIGGIGTVNDLRNDLGLSLNELTWRIEGSVRPLEHHVIRAYGTIPERYIGTNVLNRELRTRTSTYPAGSRVDSRFEIAAYGMGYDLDLLVGPSFFGGFHGDLIYMSSKVSFGTAPLRDADDVIAVHELVPCLGAHGELTSVFPFSRLTWGPKIGAFGRLTYAMTPNYLNYVDIKLGLSLRGSARRPVACEETGPALYPHN